MFFQDSFYVILGVGEGDVQYSAHLERCDNVVCGII